MKKRILLLAVAVCLLFSSIPVQAVEPRWTNTLKIVLAQDYYFGEGLYCYVEIVGHSHATSIQNIDVVVSKQVGDSWVEIASWLDYSVNGQEYVGEYIADHLTMVDVLNETIRLCVSADVYAGSSVEHVEVHNDVEY